MSATRSLEFDVKDIGLAKQGKQRIEWAGRAGNARAAVDS